MVRRADGNHQHRRLGRFDANRFGAHEAGGERPTVTPTTGGRGFLLELHLLAFRPRNRAAKPKKSDPQESDAHDLAKQVYRHVPQRGGAEQAGR